MIPWKLVASAAIPGETRELRLLERDGEFVIRAGARELMSSRSHASEESLGTLAAAKLTGRRAPRILIGGLGMGYTLAGTLRGVGVRASVVVAELCPAVLEWNRGPLGCLAGNPLSDPRVRVCCEDVALLIRGARARYDAILLDVDNGPEASTRAANGWLYETSGLLAAQAALHPRGVLAIWSATGDRRFSKRLRAAGFEVEETRAAGRSGERGGRRMVWLAVAP